MLLPYLDRNLILTGYTGPNQPVVGRVVAERLKLRYVNVDLLIEERADMSIDDVRARFGEARLKMMESEVMQDALLYRGVVMRASGQTLLRGDYGKRLAETGPIVCLVVSLDTVLRRLHLSLGGRYHNPQERALALGQLKREWAVRKLDGVHELDVTYLNEAEIVDTVIERWRELAANGSH
jgi:shikimate kinase